MTGFFRNNRKYGRRRPRRAPPWPAVAPVVKQRRHRKRRRVHARPPSNGEAKPTQAALRRHGRREATLPGRRRRSTAAIDAALRSGCVHRHGFDARRWNEPRKRRRRRRRGSRRRRPEDAVTLVDDPRMEVALDRDLACHIARDIKHLLEADGTRRVASASLNWTLGQFDVSIDLIRTGCGGDRVGARPAYALHVPIPSQKRQLQLKWRSYTITTWANTAHVVVVLTDKQGLTATTNNLGLAVTTASSLHAKPRATNNLGLAELTTNTTHTNDYLFGPCCAHD